MSETLQLLGGLTVEQFLNEYWQKKPLLIRNAFPGFQSPLSPDELAGLACETGVESRIILEKDGPAPWSIEHGPFSENRFTSLPETHWTLLVQGVDTWIPEVAELIEPFRFIPDWRIDDIMISYAPEHGSVGPHLDQYDVFLIQAQGHRHWQINTQSYADEDCIPGIDLSILRQFNPEQQWTLSPGDMLYLPPNVAHYGVAQDDCMTYSVGFRAPAQSELISAFIDDLLPGLSDAQRYQDTSLQQQDNPGQISADTLSHVQNIIRFNELDNQAIHRWFGRYITEPKNLPETIADDLDKTNIINLLKSHSVILRDPLSRFAFINNQENGFLYINGEEYTCDIDFADFVCRYKKYPAAKLINFMSGNSAELIIELFNQQLLLAEDV